MTYKWFRLSLALAAALTAGTAHAQEEAPPSHLSRVLSHLELGLQGTGVFPKGTSGPVLAETTSGQGNSSSNVGQTLNYTTSHTFGGLFDVRATKSPYVGMEVNIGYSRYTHTFDCCNLQGGAQANAEEFTLGYVVHPRPTIFGVKLSAAAGGGTTYFHPTTFGGQALLAQARMTYYYNVAGDIPLNDHFAIRAGFRQLFYLAPDFGANFLYIKKRTTTSEPVVGFILHF